MGKKLAIPPRSGVNLSRNSAFEPPLARFEVVNQRRRASEHLGGLAQAQAVAGSPEEYFGDRHLFVALLAGSWLNLEAFLDFA